MAITYTSKTEPLSVISGILEEVFFNNKTISSDWVTFNDDIKAGTLLTDESMVVTAQLYTGAALSSSGSITLTDRTISPTKLEYKQTFLQDALRTSRFKTTMKPGAWNIESSEFASKVLAKYGPKVSADAESLFWGGITAATQTAIAALTPGAGQGSMTAATQTAVAALTPRLIDGVFAKVLYDNSAIGGYIKVTGTTVTSANIAAECAKWYAAILPAVLDQEDNAPLVACPRAWRQLARIANNAVGAAQQINFLFDGEGTNARCFYNGVEMIFVPTPNNLMAYSYQRTAVSWNTDLVDDVNKFEVGLLVNDGDTQFIRAIYTLAANVAQATNGVLYGG